MTTQRTDPPRHADERTMLASFLDYHRQTMEWKCSELSPAQLRERALPPSNMSLLGLVRHLADVERGWFRRTLGGEDAPRIYYSEEDPDGEFDNVADADVDEAFGTWRAECARSRELLAAAPDLEVDGTQRDGSKMSLRWIMLHMIEEYARHNGHADLLRERIDGATGE
ncbi:MAG: DinB family protein [Labedaea sp.]